MLLYNHKKEFIGIAGTYLEIFNLSGLDEIKSLVNDFADFFISLPGYIHNFVHIHWLDYILYDDSNVAHKVVMDIKGAKYSANINIKKIYLVEQPSKEAYIVNFSDIRVLNEELKEEIKCDIVKDTSKTTPQKQLQDEMENELVIKLSDEMPQPKKSNYMFDAKLTSDELGLPVDLVEEFLQDFIAQSESFKGEMLNAIKVEDISKIHTLSHKLKGVAANLRIEDALEILTSINRSESILQIQKETKEFYDIIQKLSLRYSVDDIELSFKD